MDKPRPVEPRAAKKSQIFIIVIDLLILLKMFYFIFKSNAAKARVTNRIDSKTFFITIKFSYY